MQEAEVMSGELKCMREKTGVHNNKCSDKKVSLVRVGSSYMDPVTGDPGTRSYGYVDPNAPVVMSGGNGGNNNDADPFNIAPSYTNNGYVDSGGFINASPPPSDLFSGGGADGKGNFGKIGDYFGGIGNAITNF
jgi:hypothetical protein